MGRGKCVCRGPFSVWSGSCSSARGGEPRRTGSGIFAGRCRMCPAPRFLSTGRLRPFTAWRHRSRGPLFRSFGPSGCPRWRRWESPLPRTRSVSWMRSRVPSRRHRRKQGQTVLQGGKSWSRARPVQPLHRTLRMPLTISRGSTGFGGRNHGAHSCHWASVRSLG